MARVQIQDLPEPERFRPVQPTGDTFGGAERPVIDQNWERLSSALASFSSNISQFARRDNKAIGDQLQAQYLQMRQQAGNGAAAGAVMSGQIPVLQHPRAGPVAANQIGADQARDWLEQQRRDLAQGTYPLFDAEGRPTDVGAVHSQRVNEHYARQPPQFQIRPGVVNPLAAAYQTGFANEVEKAREEAIAKQREAVASENNAVIDASISRFLSPLGAEAGRRDENGRWAVSDDQLRELWAKQRQEVRSFFTPPGRQTADSVIDYRRIDARMVGILGDLAKDNPEAALRLMYLNRGRSAEGVELGPLAANPLYQNRLTDLAREARNKAISNEENRILNQTADNYARQLRAGNGLALQGATDRTYESEWDLDPNTRTRRIPAERIRNEAFARAATAEEADIRRQGSSPEVTDEAIFQSGRRLYIQSNVPNPQWREAINGTVRLLGDPAALSDPANERRVMAARELYNRLSREHPQYLRTLGINDDAELLFQRADILEKMTGDPRRSLSEAAASLQGRTEAMDAAARTRLETEGNRLGSSWWNMQSAGSNVMEARRNIMAAAERLMFRSDIKPEDAIKKAAETLTARTVNLNGRSHIGDRWITRESLPYWQAELGKIVREYGALAGAEAVRDPSKLRVRPINNGAAYQVLDSENVPVRAPVRVTGPDGVERMEMRPVIIDPKRVQTAMEQDIAAKAAGERAEVLRQAEINGLRSRLSDADNAARQGGRQMGFQPLTPEERKQIEDRLVFLGDRVIGRAPEDGGQPPPTRAAITGRNPFGSTTVDPRTQRMGDEPDPAPLPNPLTDLFNRLQRPEAEQQDVRQAQERAANALRRRNNRQQ